MMIYLFRGRVDSFSFLSSCQSIIYFCYQSIKKVRRSKRLSRRLVCVIVNLTINIAFLYRVPFGQNSLIILFHYQSHIISTIKISRVYNTYYTLKTIIYLIYLNYTRQYAVGFVMVSLNSSGGHPVFKKSVDTYRYTMCMSSFCCI